MNHASAFREVIALIRARVKGLATATLAACALCSAAHAIAGPPETLRVGTDGAYPPYNFTTPEGGLAGFEIDLVKDLCVRMQIKCVFVSVDFNGLIPKLQDGDVNLVMSALSITPERARVIDFSLPYFAGPTYFLARAGTPVVYRQTPVIVDLDHDSDVGRRSLAELARHLQGEVIGVEGATTHEDYVRKYFPGVARIRVYPTQQELFLDLAIGRVDAVCDDLVNSAAFIKHQAARGNRFVMFGPGVRGGILGEGVAFGMRRGDAALERKVNAALRAAGRQGTISRLSVRWFGFDGSVRYDSGSTAAVPDRAGSH